jgi:GNAT superfamily N-acetyltransferase
MEMDYVVAYLADHPAYVEEVGHLKYGQWLHTSPDRPYEVWIDEIRHSARKNAFPMTLIALRGAELLGFVTLIELEEKADIEHGLWLITLYVKANYRRKGIGAALIERCIEEAGQMGHPALYLWTESSELTGYYGRRGWCRIGRDAGSGEEIMVYELEGYDDVGK